MGSENINIPLVDLKTQYANLKDEIDSLISEVLENAAFICGKYVSLFEKEFARLHGFKNFIGVSSGTDAVHLMLWASGISKDDEVVIPVNTFIATAEGISLCGAKPIFVDIDEYTYNMDVNKLERVISNRTKAIITVHLYGQSANMKEILEIASSKDILIFEDACQAHFASYRGMKVGNFGLASAFSFYPGKNLGAYGEGGGIATNDDQLFDKIRKMRNHGEVEKYKHDLIGHNYRMDEIQGAVLYAKLKYLKIWTERRRKIASHYKKKLSTINEIICPHEAKGCVHVYHLFVIRVLNGKRDKLREFLLKNGIHTGLHYPIPLHLQKAYRFLGYKRGDFPKAEKVASEILSLPIYPELELDQVDYICEKIYDFFNKGYYK